jgi:hypothetical protein
VTRRGRAVVYEYLKRFGRSAFIVAVAGIVIEVLAGCLKSTALDPVPGYGLVVGGSMLGAWLSAAANRRDVSFDQLPDFLASEIEPTIRAVFVALLAIAVALLLDQGAIKLWLGSTDLALFDRNASIAILLGIVAGVSERALSVRVLQRFSGYVAK